MNQVYSINERPNLNIINYIDSIQNSDVKFLSQALIQKREGNYSLLARNLDTLKVVALRTRFFSYLSSKSNKGTYLPEINTIQYIKESIGLPHEFIHVATTYYDKDRKICFNGFEQTVVQEKRIVYEIAHGFNDSYTDLMAVRYLNAKSLYKTEDISSIVEDIIGREVMENLFFDANLLGLFDEIKKNGISPESFIEFLSVADNYTQVMSVFSAKQDERYLFEGYKLLEKICKQLYGFYGLKYDLSDLSNQNKLKQKFLNLYTGFVVGSEEELQVLKNTVSEGLNDIFANNNNTEKNK